MYPARVYVVYMKSEILKVDIYLYIYNIVVLCWVSHQICSVLCYKHVIWFVQWVRVSTLIITKLIVRGRNMICKHVEIMLYISNWVFILSGPFFLLWKFPVCIMLTWSNGVGWQVSECLEDWKNGCYAGWLNEDCELQCSNWLVTRHSSLL